ncbi:hypothetical protein EI94DRAFT_1900634 [Lactarius quietus]|nr:hypothetical protein EI94DRAFT_1900634 [Lactarius quietus]
MQNHSIAELAKEKGNVAFKANDDATARSLYSHAMIFDPSNHLYPLNRSVANLKLARWDEAEADATKTPVMSPRNLKALYRRGLARKGLGKWDQARADIQMFLDNGGNPTLGAQELRSIADTETIQEGKGAFASRNFQRGDLILAEKPIFSIRIDVPKQLQHISIEAAVRNLSPVHLDGFLSLQNSHTECSCFPNRPLLGIYTTNGFGLGFGGSGAGVCVKASRFNHSCAPNARFSFNSDTGELRIYALGTISRGEEIFVAYSDRFIDGRRLYGTPRLPRQAHLRQLYHFTCACSTCSLPAAESMKSDARRLKLIELREIIQSLYLSPFHGTQVLNYIVEATQLLKEEKYFADSDDFTTYGAVVCAFHSDWVSAKYWAHLTYHTRVGQCGEDSPRIAEVRGEYLDQRSYPKAGRGPLKDFTAIRL